jgi:hypothetical protein
VSPLQLKNQNWKKKEIYQMLILKNLEHSLWCHLYFITETRNCRASSNMYNILTQLKCKFVSKLPGLLPWKEFWQSPCPSSLWITYSKI